MGAVRSAAAARAGATGRSRCWGTPPTRCCRSSPRAPPWRSRMRPCWPTGWRARPTIRPTRMRRYERARRAAHRAGAARGPPQRHGLSPGRRRGVAAQSRAVATGGGKLLLRRYDWLYGWQPARRACRCTAGGTSGRGMAERCFDDHHRRQPAEAGLARRAEQAVAAVAARRRRARRRQARRHAARAQGAGGRRHRHRHRRRAVAPAFRARLPRIRRRHRLRAQGRDGHPQQPLQGDGAAGRRRAAAQGPRARHARRGSRARTPSASSRSPCRGR